MKAKFFILLWMACMTIGVRAQTYTIVSRSNDTIRLHANKLGDALKSALPGGGATENYRLIEKVDDGKKSLLFVDFVQLVDKIFVVYETDLIHAGEWQMTTYSFDSIFNAVKRVDAILLKGQLLGMDIAIFQRPNLYKDVINIDGIEFDLPLKVQVFEAKQALAEAKQAQVEAKQAQESKKNDFERLGLTEDDVTNMSGKANECYIAYLLMGGHFNKLEDRSLLSQLCDQNEVVSISGMYNSEQLKYLSKGHDWRLNVYAK